MGARDFGPIPWGAWRPDVAGPGSGFAQVAEGGYPISTVMGVGYAPFPQLEAAAGSEALASDPRGIISLQAPDNNWYVFAATDASIYRLLSDFTWEEIDSGRTVTAGDDVSMCLMGKYLINTDTTSGLRAYDVVSGGTNDAVSGAPGARAVFVCHNTLFALGTASSPRRFASSDLGNYAAWSGGTADAKTLEDGGALVGGADIKNGAGVMLQERCIRGIQFGAGAASYTLSKIADGIGCVAERTIASYDGKVWWWHEDGPWMLEGGGAPVPIGAEKINRWAKESIGRENFKNLQATVDAERKLVIWRIDASRLLAYSWLLNDFSILPATTSAVARIASPALTVDDLTGDVDSLAGTSDSLGGTSTPELGGLNNSRRYSTFTGPNMAATLETCAVDLGGQPLIGRVQPADNSPDGTVAVGTSYSEDEALEWDAAQSKINGTRHKYRGWVNARARGTFAAFRRVIPGGSAWSYTLGVRKVEAN